MQEQGTILIAIVVIATVLIAGGIIYKSMRKPRSYHPGISSSSIAGNQLSPPTSIAPLPTIQGGGLRKVPSGSTAE